MVAIWMTAYSHQYSLISTIQISSCHYLGQMVCHHFRICMQILLHFIKRATL